MLSRESCRQRVVDACAAALGFAVDGDGDADAGAAYGDPALRIAGRHGAGEASAIFGIVDAFGAVRAKVDYLMTLLAQPAGELILEDVASVIGGEGNAHGPYLASNRSVRHRPPACA